jgi:hypothetical protein
LNRTSFIAGILAIVLVVAAFAIWTLLRSSAGRGRILPAELICYTNDVTGIATASYADTNIAHNDFAVFRIDNPTGRSFFGYIGPVFSGEKSFQFRNASGGDFDLLAGRSTTFAVPVPEIKKWQCAVVLCRMDQGQSRLQALLWKVSNLIGLEHKSWVAVSEEITK